MSVQNFETTKVPILGLPLENPKKKCHLDVAPMKRHRIYYRGGEWCLLSKVVGHVKLVLEVVPIKSITPFVFNLH
jgi:hypothetical protein